MDSDSLTIREMTSAELPRIPPLTGKHNAKVEPAELRRRLEAMIALRRKVGLDA